MTIYNKLLCSIIAIINRIRCIRNTLIVSDRRNVGSLLGASLLGLLGFVLFSGTLVFAFVGGAAGFALGRFIGWRLKARKKAAEPLNENQMY